MRLPDAASDGPQLRGFGVEIIATLKSGFVERNYQEAKFCRDCWPSVEEGGFRSVWLMTAELLVQGLVYYLVP